MNIVFVSDDHRESEFLKRELSEHNPANRIDIAPNTEKSLFRFVVSNGCDVILLDASVPDGDAVNLIENIRNEKKPIGVVALVGAGETELPIELYYAGVDRFILKRDGYIAPLVEAIKEAKELHPPEPAPSLRPVQLYYAGDFEEVRSHLAGVAHVTVKPLMLSPDGALQLPDMAALPGALIVIDSGLTGSQTLKAVQEIKQLAPDVPTILLTSPGDEETANQAMRSGATDCISKTGDHIQRLLPAIARETGRLQLIREKTAHKSREDRLRQIVEIMPAGIMVIAPDGTFMAVNRNGLRLMGARRIEQIIGKNLVHLVPPEEQERVLAFLTTVSGWTSALIRLNWTGLDGTVPGVELRAVPMRRESADTAAILAAIYGFDSQSTNQRALDHEGQREAPEYKLLFQELQETFSRQQSQWKAQLQQAETRRAAAEKQLAQLQAAAEKDAVRVELLLNEQRTEQTNWKQSNQRLQEKCAKLEKIIQSLAPGQTSLVESHNAEREQWADIRQQLDQRCHAAEEQITALKAALHDAQSNIIQLSERHTIAISQRDFAQKKTEQKYQAAEKQRTALQNALEVAESSLARISELRAQWDHNRQELEQKCQAPEKQVANRNPASPESHNGPG